MKQLEKKSGEKRQHYREGGGSEKYGTLAREGWRNRSFQGLATFQSVWL